MSKPLERCLLLIPVLCLSLTALAAAADLAAPRHTTLPLVGEPPVIDGKLDDAVWKQASRLTNFLDLKRLKRTVSEQTTVLAMRDRENLYFGFLCDSHAPESIKAVTPPGRPESKRLYKDDVVEVFIDTEHSKNDCYHWIANVNGAIFDEVRHRLIYTERMLPSAEWNSSAEAAGSRGDAQWFVELRIPLSDLTARDRKALEENETWGLQFGRENWTLPEGGPEYSTWSATYSFIEPESYGVAAFTGEPTVEERRAWVQQADPSMALMDPPQRPDYTFVRCFDFGPPPEEEEVAADDPEGVLFVDPETGFTAARGFGFENAAGLTARRSADRKFSTGGRLSPLSSDYVKSTNPAVFRFELPAGDYYAAILCGKNYFLGDVGGMDYEVAVNDGRARCYHQEAGRIFLPVWVPFETDGRAPVTMRIAPAPGTSWALCTMVVCPRGDYAEARGAFYWLERDCYNYPFEKTVNRVEAWIDIPAGNTSPRVLEAEQEKGFAVFGLSPTAFVPGSYVPEETDPRDKAVAIASPGFTTALMIGFHALRPHKNLRAAIGGQPGDGVRVQLLQLNDMLVNVGKLTMNQMGRFPKLLARVEPTWLEPQRTQAYFLSADIDVNAVPGVRRGTLALHDGEQKLADFPFEFVVLPFAPSNRTDTIRSVFYNPPICGNFARGRVGREKADLVAKTRHQLEDLKRHGINAVHAYADSAAYKKEEDGLWHFRPRDNERVFWEMLRELGIREHAVTIPILEGQFYSAMINDYLERGGHEERVVSMTTRYVCKDRLPPEFFENVTLLIRQNLAERAKGGYSLPSFDAWDEPGHINSEAYVPILDAIRAGGGRTCVQTIAACYPTLSGRVDVRTYDMGSLAVAGGEAASPEQVAAMKAKDGTTYSVYPNATIMGGDPRASRHMFGYFVWAWNLDGADPYKYWKILGDYRLSAGYQAGSFHPMMFDANGDTVFSTPSWENFAEGIYDNSLVQELVYLTQSPHEDADPEAVEAGRGFAEALRRQTAFHPSFIARGHDSRTAAPKFTRFNWHPYRFESLRADMAARIMRLKRLDQRYPDLMRVLDAEADARRARAERLDAARNKGAPPPRKGNLIVNGDFENIEEDAVRGWRRWSGFEKVSPNAQVQTAVRRSGKQAIRFDHADRQSWDHVRTEMIALVPGRTYEFSGWARRQAERKEGTALWTGFMIKTYAKTNYTDTSKDQFIQRRGLWFPQNTPTFDWQAFKYPFTAGESEHYVNFTLYNNDVQGVIYYDDLALKEYGAD